MKELQFFQDDGSKTLRQLFHLRGRYRSDSDVMAIYDRLQKNLWISTFTLVFTLANFLFHAH